MDRAFKIFDRSGTGKVSLDEYTETLSQLVGNNNDGAIHFLFNIYDDNSTLDSDYCIFVWRSHYFHILQRMASWWRVS